MIEFDPEFKSAWLWEALEARSEGNAPEVFLPLLDKAHILVVTDKQAEEIVSWAATLPDWETDRIQTAKHPLKITDINERAYIDLKEKNDDRIFITPEALK